LGPDERAIRELHLTWIDAVNAGDLVGLLGSMADDVLFLRPGETPFGRDAFSPRFSAAHEQARINCISELEDVVVVGEVAYTLSRETARQPLAPCPRYPHVVTSGEARGVSGVGRGSPRHEKG
jgi:uncharacterized protein (TIGR02246 family)